jgi:hypothetical protein
VSLPFRKTQKIVSYKDGDQMDDKFLHQVEENINGFSFKQSYQSPAMNIQTFLSRCAETRNWRLISTKSEYELIR